MSKNLISGLIVVAVIAIGGYFIFKGDKAPNPGDVKGEETTETGKKMAFSEFVKQGGSYKCTVKQAMNDFENSGTVYINGAQMRGEFSTIAEGRNVDTTFIVTDGYTYSWSSMLPNMGFKMKINPGTNGGGSADTSGTYSFNSEQIGDYNCEPWTVDASMFATPSGMTFTKIEAK